MWFFLMFPTQPKGITVRFTKKNNIISIHTHEYINYSVWFDSIYAKCVMDTIHTIEYW